MPDKKVPIRDYTLFGSDISFFPPEDKNALWLGQMLFFMKQNSEPFLDVKRWKTYNKLDMMELNTQEYIDMVDPPDPMKRTGGKAEYFASDFKDIPVAQHLDNILRAKLDKIGVDNQLQVNEIDKYSIPQRQREKQRIEYQGLFRELINEVYAIMGQQPMSPSKDPYKYVAGLNDKGGKSIGGNVDTVMDYIRQQVQDSQDMTLFMTYIYKGDIEKAIELVLQHYLINLNKWSVVSQAFYKDMKNFNKMCGRIYTDETTGRQNVEYLVPITLNTSTFSCYDGEDITHWFYEKNITFADFVRQFGQGLSDEQLKEVFELNKINGGGHGMNYSKARGVKGANAKIRIGVMSCLTQDAEKFSKKYATNSIPTLEPKPLSWLPDKRTPNKYKSELEQKIYNVWYSCYYIPPPGGRLASNSQTDWAWQSQYIFNIHKETDMYRYGTDMRYAKSSLVIWKDDRPSFKDIEEAFMPKIRNAWHQFQNCLINDIDAVGLSEDFIGAMLNAVDEANNSDLALKDKPTGGNGVDARLVSMQQIKQGGMAFLKMTDKQGKQLVDPSKFVISIKNGMLEKAEKYLNIILQLYNLTTVSLAQNDISEGQDVKPRTAVAGIQASLVASAQGTWFIEKGARQFLVMFGERTIQWLLYVLKEHKKYKLDSRWSELQTVIGMANSMALETIDEYNPEQIGLTVSLEDVRAKKQFYSELAVQMLKDGKIDDGDLQMIVDAINENYKYGSTLLNIASKKMKRELANQQALQQEYAKELKDKDLQIALALQKAKGDSKDQNIVTEGKVNEMIDEKLNDQKQQHQLQIKDKISQNRIEENANKSEQEKEKEMQKAFPQAG